LSYGPSPPTQQYSPADQTCSKRTNSRNALAKIIWGAAAPLAQTLLLILGGLPPPRTPREGNPGAPRILPGQVVVWNRNMGFTLLLDSLSFLGLEIIAFSFLAVANRFFPVFWPWVCVLAAHRRRRPSATSRPCLCCLVLLVMVGEAIMCRYQDMSVGITPVSKEGFERI
jgi:hypothetical protein